MMSNTKRHLFKTTNAIISFKMKLYRFSSCFNQVPFFKISEEKRLFSIVPVSMGFSFIDNFKTKLLFTKLALS